MSGKMSASSVARDILVYVYQEVGQTDADRRMAWENAFGFVGLKVKVTGADEMGVFLCNGPDAEQATDIVKSIAAIGRLDVGHNFDLALTDLKNILQSHRFYAGQ